jgi:hypothetical protein
MTGVRKAAVLLVAVGETLAKEILRALPEADVQLLTEELADLRGITTEVTTGIMEEFWELLETQNYMVHGGLDYASRLLVDTFGKERADDLLALVRRSQEAAQGNLAKLQRTDPQQLGKLLDTEHPQTIALVLAHLDPRRASLVLDNLSEEHKVVSVQRLAEMRQFSPEMAQKVAHILHRRLESVGDTARKSRRPAEPPECRRSQEDSRDHRRRSAGARAQHSQSDVHLRRPGDGARGDHPRNRLRRRQAAVGAGLARRQRRVARPDIQGHEFARRRDVEGGYGSPRPGPIARGCGGPTGDSQPGPAVGGRRQSDSETGDRRRDDGLIRGSRQSGVTAGES